MLQRLMDAANPQQQQQQTETQQFLARLSEDDRVALAQTLFQGALTEGQPAAAPAPAPNGQPPATPATPAANGQALVQQGQSITMTPEQLQELAARLTGSQPGAANAATPAGHQASGLGTGSGPVSREQAMALSNDPEAFRRDFYSPNSLIKQFLKQGS